MPLARRTPTTAAAQTNAAKAPTNRSFTWRSSKPKAKRSGQRTTWRRDELEPAIKEACERVEAGDPPNYRQLHEKYGIPKSTLEPYVNKKRQTRQESHMKQMVIDPATESILVEWCNFCTLV
jgi:hypothetical protein